ncbi:glycosyltransferase family 2 protein [Flavobacterium aquariorum]|uniref:Glycosyltransferase family 2 protein n=1 Tax=Flavobacterium aquariorum TaxID=2217670 RepID=A0A2W7U5E9_9FLAO|nr:glycosyltransferase family A protein [Flavobacterium aquariorum]PZX92459.1 glycosyltransferase family 2 protein [Flavobacterium aquariorum]
MRVGYNPHKDKTQPTSDYFHQVIIPVYIPNQEGYFKDSFEILKLCLDSLFKTIHDKTSITIVNNGSCIEVVAYLNYLFHKNKIQEVIHTTNIGKLNAVLKGISGNSFPLITVSDADVLFLNGWQDASYSIFDVFPKTGAVCPTPSSRSLRTYTANVYWDLFFSNKLKCTPVVNPDALKMFGLSVGDANFYNPDQLKKYLTITNEDKKAVVGAGHFITTYRAEVFDNLGSRFTTYKLGGDSEGQFLDLPVVKKGFWRLSTADNYTYHMGNVVEDWMPVEVSKLTQNNKKCTFELKPLRFNSKLAYFVKSKLFSKLILNKKVMRYFLIWKGLSKEEAKNYLR